MRGDDQMTGQRKIFGTDGVRGRANADAMTPARILGGFSKTANIVTGS
jgi:phosphomannomutase